MFLGTRLDVGVTYLGGVMVKCVGEEYNPALMRILVRWGEVVDNFVGDMAAARRKDFALISLFNALRNPILDEALDSAIGVSI